jgi:hypothetical protein
MYFTLLDHHGCRYQTPTNVIYQMKKDEKQRKCLLERVKNDGY